MIRKTTVIKIVKFILVLIVFIAGLFILNALMLDLSSSLIKTARHLLPQVGLTSIVCIFLICFISISIVAFVSGLFHWVSFNMIRTAVITYIILDWVTSIKHFIVIWHITGCLPPIVVTIFDALLLLLALISLKRLHTGGRKLRGKLEKT